MKTFRFLLITVLCVGLASAADAKNKRHRGKKGKKHHHTTATPAPPVPPAPGGHHTITPFVSTTNSPGTWTYEAQVTSGGVWNGDGFTIFDFGGYVDASIFAPTGWTAVAQLTGSVLNVAPPAGYVDNPSLFNLLFVRNGGTIGPTNGKIDLGFFGADTTDTSTTMVGWSSRDHNPSGGVGEPHADLIEAPAPGNHVPDGGATVALLGIGLTGLEALRRLLRARKA